MRDVKVDLYDFFFNVQLLFFRKNLNYNLKSKSGSFITYKCKKRNAV